MKTSELTGLALDWAVAKAEGHEPYTDGISWIIDRARTCIQIPKYSTDWGEGGPIIERERITIRFWENETFATAYMPPIASKYSEWSHDPSPLIAAMCCYVASKLGEEIEIPEEVL